MRSILILGTTVLLCSTALAATPEQLALAREVIRVSHAESMMDEFIPQIQQVTSQVAQQAMVQYGFTTEEGAQLANVQTKIVALMSERFKSMLPSLEQAYAEVYTDAEMKAMIQFLSSPEGQAMLRKNPEVVKRVAPELKDMVIALQPQIQLLIQREIDRIRAARGSNPVKAPDATAPKAPASSGGTLPRS